MNDPAKTSVMLLTTERWIEIGRIAALGLITLLYWLEYLPRDVLFAGVILGLYPLLKTGVKDLFKERKIGTEIFVTVATTVAMLGGEYVAGAVLLTIILIAEFIAELNTDRARASIKSLIGSVPRQAIVRRESGDQTVPIDQIQVGEIALARTGEKIPVDGIVVSGDAAVNESTITGESLPIDKTTGDKVLAGTVLESGALDIRTTGSGKDTLFARIIALVEQAEDVQAPVQKLADKVSNWLIPVVFVFLLIVYLVTRDVRLIVTLLIFTSPAELGLATPLVMIAAIARAAKSGVLIKGGIYLEQLAKAEVMAFDKTGTLTAGVLEIAAVHPFFEYVSPDDVLSLAASVDQRSAHPLAEAIVRHAKQKRVQIMEPTDFEMFGGRGVAAKVNKTKVLVGNAKLLEEHGVDLPANMPDLKGTVVYVVTGQQVIGYLELSDKLRAGAKETLEKLKASGVKRLVMLTGDNEAAAKHVATELAIDQVKAKLLPEEKVQAIRGLSEGGNVVVMIGDGVNDASGARASTSRHRNGRSWDSSSPRSRGHRTDDG